MNTFFDHYTGFEGEAKSAFKSADGKWAINLWDAYLLPIMDNVRPNEVGMWKSLALLYHTRTGWYASSPFELTEVAEALHQLKTYLPDSDNPLKAHTDLIAVFEYAARNQQSIIAEYS